MKTLALASLYLLTFTATLQALTPGKTQQLTSPDQVPEGLAKSDWQSIRAAYEAGLHAFMPTDTGWQAHNPGQQWTTQFDKRGFVAQPREGGWQWGLELKGYGFPGAEHVISGVPAVKAEGQRLSYQWDSAVQEWFVNDARGLEHGFTVAQRPEGTPSLNSLRGFAAQPSTLNFLLAIRGTLTPVITADAQGVEFRDASGSTVLNYTGLKVWDADGKALASRFERIDSQPSTLHSQPTVRLLVDERGARYPLTIDPIAQQAYLKPAAVGTTQAGDTFGTSVAVSGDTVVVGAPYEGSSTTGVNSTPDESAGESGAVYVFVRSGGAWTQQAYLKPAAVGTTQAGDQFGYSVAISGDTVVVGAPIEDSSTTGINSTPNESASKAGAAYVFTRSGATWSQQAYLKPGAVGTTQAGDQFGQSVAVSGDTVVVGVYGEDSGTTGINSTPDESASNAGAAYVFVRSGSTWSQQAYLKPGAIGTTQSFDRFGYSVAVAGDTVVIGAVFEDSSTTGINSTPNESAGESGAAYVFVRSGTTWTQQAYLKPAAIGTTQEGDRFGASVAVSGDTVVVGALSEASSTTGVNSTPDESAANAGAAYVFTRSGATWSQQAYLKPAAVGTSQAGDRFGCSVAVSGDTVVVGAIFEDSSTTGVNSTPNESAAMSGAAYVFTRSGTVWSQQAYLKPGAVGTTQAGDNFGASVAVSGDTVVVGAWLEASSTTGVNSTPDEAASAAGAAYLFTVPLTVTTTADEFDTPSGAQLSLREALRDVSDGNTILFDSTLDGQTITLGSELVIAKNVTIDASSLPNGITLNGNHATRLFTVNSGASVTLQNLTLTNGNGTGGNVTFQGYGGAIFNQGTLSLTQCSLVGNASASGVYGGAVQNFGLLTLTQCLLANNTSPNGQGGAINSANNSNSLFLTNCTLTGNSARLGGAILGSAILNHCTVSGNTATNIGGGIFIIGNQLNLAHSIIAGNSASSVTAGPDLHIQNNLGSLTGTNFIGNLADTGLTASATLLIGDPQLAPLGSYGGPTQTMPPLPGSPVINASIGSSAVVDQRGAARPVGAAPDLGAVEENGLIVRTTANSGPGSLRQAIADAATLPGADTITFAPALSGQTIALASEIVMNMDNVGNVTLDASSLPGGLTLSGGGTHRILSVNAQTGTFGTVTLVGLTLTGGNGVGAFLTGYGGAIYNSATTMTMTRCTLSGNSGSEGGAIYSEYGTLTLTQCTLSGNSAGNSGGAIGSGNGSGTLTQCTFFGNSAIQGGAISNSGPLTLTQCTLSGNSASLSGGGAIDHAGNTLTLSNCIVAGNTAPFAVDILNNDSVTGTGKNLIGSNESVTAAFPSGVLVGTAASPLNPQLAPLGSYGGPTQTMALLTGSPAIDPAGADTTSPFATDQRGLPRVTGGKVDIGAVESAPATDYTPGAFAFGTALFIANEEAGTVQVPIVRSGNGLVAADVFVVSAEGTATIADYNAVGNVVSFAIGETQKTVTVTLFGDPWLKEPNEAFTLTLSGPTNGATLGTPNPCTVRILDGYDVTNPGAVTFTAPAANAVILESAGPGVPVTGTAKDDKGVAKVQVSLNGSAFADAVLTLSSDGKSTTFATTVRARNGLNTITARTVDTRGRLSAATARSFTYQVDRTLTLMINGPANSGTLSTGFMPTSTRKAGTVYTITATPKPGFVFNGWSAYGTANTGITTDAAELPTLAFIMQTNLGTLVANFIANPFTPAVIGTFNGLVKPSGLTATGNDTVGLLANAIVTDKGTFTSTLKIDGLTKPVNGLFYNDGTSRFGATRTRSLTIPRAGKPNLDVTLILDMTAMAHQITGSVKQTIRGAVTANSTVSADRAYYSTTTKVPAALAGTATKPYTLVFNNLDSSFDPQYVPQGDGYATMTVSVNGTVSLTGNLADHTPITASAPLSQAGTWPIFAQLYTGMQGCFAGMATLTDANATTEDVTGADLLWVRPFQSVQWYPYGWNDLTVEAHGARYVVPPAFPATSVFPLTTASDADGNGSLTFSNGLLSSSPLTFAMNINTANVATTVPAAMNPTLVITKTSGVITGKFPHSDGTSPTYQGAILQKGANKGGHGYFMTTSPKVLNYLGESGKVEVLTQ